MSVAIMRRQKQTRAASGLRCSIVLVCVLLAHGQPAQVDICGFQLPPDNVTICDEKSPCNGTCPSTTCLALVEFNKGMNYALSSNIVDEDGVQYSTKPWARDPAVCATMTEPEYCSWHGVGCCCGNTTGALDRCDKCQAIRKSSRGSVGQLELQGLRLEAPLHKVLVQLGALGKYGLWSLELQNNNFTGSIPANLSLLFPDLVLLNLGSNEKLTGPVPKGLDELTSLEELNLEYTSLTGSLPIMCAPNGGSRLADVFIRGTYLTGDVTEAFRNCSQLISLNLQV
jgi:hypothetical protein